MKEHVRPPLKSRGFALVVTLSLMILLTLIAVGLLSLSVVSLRTGGQEIAQGEARSNARLALIMAIGELQKQAGADTRITAPADILDPANPPLTGVWKSWQGDDHETTGALAGRPKPPMYTKKKESEGDGGRFLSWLVSGTVSKTSPGDAKSLVQKAPSGTSVPLVSTGSLATGDARQVHIEPVSVSGKGKFAWWVSGENQKAHLPKPYKPQKDNAAGWSDLARSHAVADPKGFELESLLDDASPAEKAFTRNTADFFVGKNAATRPSRSFHDLSATSVGMLTNVATGGWRKDLSLLAESWASQPGSGLELFQLSPNKSLTFTRPIDAADFRLPGSLFYPWSDYRPNPRNEEIFLNRGPVSSWACLADYVNLYKEMTSSSSTAPRINIRSWPYTGYPNQLNGLHKTWVMPQFARFQMIVSHYATATNAASGLLRPAVLYTPVITLWNPFNTEILMPGKLHIRAGYSLPLALRHQLSGKSLPNEYWAVQNSRTDSYSGKGLMARWKYGWEIRFEEQDMVLKPGETRVFSPAAGFLKDETHDNGNYTACNVSPGIRKGVGVYYALDRRLSPNGDFSPAKVSLPQSTRVDVDAKFDVAAENKLSATGQSQNVCGMFFQWNINQFKDPQHGNVTAHYLPQDANDLYPPLEELASVTLGECANNPVPFLSMIFGSRIANHRATATKGMVQANPLVTFTVTGFNGDNSDIYPGGKNLLNSPWDFSFVEHPAGPGDDMLPNFDNSTNSGFIVTGVRKAEGIARFVTAELPTRPPVSLGDLSHWQMRGLNPTPTFGSNLIANSDASPLLSKNSLVNPDNVQANQRKNEQQDDAYCANHLLFDDWFFSSISPEPTNFGPSGKNQRTNYTDFLMKKDPLANRAYRPIIEDSTTDPTAANKSFTERVAPANSWKTIASRLEVEGMFNVNSTSVKAWRALLGHARNQKIPQITNNGTITLSGEKDHALSRTSLAGDREAGQAPENGGYFATTEFTGYRVFSPEMLDFLAEKTVEQVRLRGPFLSLSEFVNRQLSNDTGLAMAGAIQTALNQLADHSSLNPFKVMQAESVPSLPNPAGQDDYAFPDAAEGHNTYGLPGWTRQADILRPLAPILSARDDTFTIRTYGDARSTDGKILAKAWCEAVIRRTRNFCDPSEKPDITTAPVNATNVTYGRKFQMVSFRWLSAAEI
jgi:hypothetical protein